MGDFIGQVSALMDKYGSDIDEIIKATKDASGAESMDRFVGIPREMDEDGVLTAQSETVKGNTRETIVSYEQWKAPATITLNAPHPPVEAQWKGDKIEARAVWVFFPDIGAIEKIRLLAEFGIHIPPRVDYSTGKKMVILKGFVENTKGETCEWEMGLAPLSSSRP